MCQKVVGLQCPLQKGAQQLFGPYLLWRSGRPSQQLLRSRFAPFTVYTRNSYVGVHELHEMTATNTYITSAAQYCFLTCLQVHNNNISSNFKNSNKINKLLLFKWHNRSYGQKKISVQLPAGRQLCNDCGQIVHTLVPPHQEV